MPLPTLKSYHGPLLSRVTPISLSVHINNEDKCEKLDPEMNLMSATLKFSPSELWPMGIILHKYYRRAEIGTVLKASRLPFNICRVTLSYWKIKRTKKKRSSRYLTCPDFTLIKSFQHEKNVHTYI